LREALAGRFRVGHHGLLVAQMLAHIDFLDAAIAELDTTLERAATPFQAVLKRVCTIPGVSVRTAVMLLAECGADMTVFRTPPTAVDSIPARVTRCSASQSPSAVIPAVVVAKVRVCCARWRRPERWRRPDPGTRTVATTVSRCTSNPAQRCTNTSIPGSSQSASTAGPPPRGGPVRSRV
jgi:hypothetical protein